MRFALMTLYDKKNNMHRFYTLSFIGLGECADYLPNVYGWSSNIAFQIR